MTKQASRTPKVFGIPRDDILRTTDGRDFGHETEYGDDSFAPVDDVWRGVGLSKTKSERDVEKAAKAATQANIRCEQTRKAAQVRLYCARKARPTHTQTTWTLFLLFYFGCHTHTHFPLSPTLHTSIHPVISLFSPLKSQPPPQLLQAQHDRPPVVVRPVLIFACCCCEVGAIHQNQLDAPPRQTTHPFHGSALAHCGFPSLISSYHSPRGQSIIVFSR